MSCSTPPDMMKPPRNHIYKKKPVLRVQSRSRIDAKLYENDDVFNHCTQRANQPGQVFYNVLLVC